MTSELKVFENPTFGQVRTVEVDGEPWFVGKDVAEALGYSNTRDALSKHVDEDDKATVAFHDGSQNRNVTAVNESGLYSLILSSKLPGAKEFKRWVISEVIPSIRKTGGYTLKPKPMTEYQQMMADTRRRNARVQSARILTQLAKQYKGSTYEQVLNAHATKELTGEFLLPLPKLEEKTYSATEIGQMFGISANKVGLLTNRHGLKTEQYGQWFKDKSRYGNKEVYSFRYFEKVIPIIRDLLEREAS
jgi:prophage antirepressor-like protein